MEQEPKESDKAMWARLGQIVLLQKLLEESRLDWNGSGVKSWAWRNLEELTEVEDG